MMMSGVAGEQFPAAFGIVKRNIDRVSSAIQQFVNFDSPVCLKVRSSTFHRIHAFRRKITVTRRLNRSIEPIEAKRNRKVSKIAMNDVGVRSFELHAGERAFARRIQLPYTLEHRTSTVPSLVVEKGARNELSSMDWVTGLVLFSTLGDYLGLACGFETGEPVSRHRMLQVLEVVIAGARSLAADRFSLEDHVRQGVQVEPDTSGVQFSRPIFFPAAADEPTHCEAHTENLMLTMLSGMEKHAMGFDDL
ncbi:hypothetical protein AXG93_3384s1780 [Marchantia polymorpha subsp. ruderalis]|uniref:Uncharacterized protein n=1 Tax=Marchantia polymorpha subsp. ruderalis TaxID=1480154 RepID=A0A176WFL8_MARPO|nr:hypothetical protein AXG93_3384s1780 [Marchantia polymorpha subsp. ruderalis]